VTSFYFVARGTHAEASHRRGPFRPIVTKRDQSFPQPVASTANAFTFAKGQVRLRVRLADVQLITRDGQGGTIERFE
jgi:hypothetical protein